MTLLDIEQAIQQAIPGCQVWVMDPNHDGEHLQAVVVSSSFENIPLIKQHQMVMRPLTKAFDESLHALALKTFTPDKWQDVKEEYSSFIQD